MVSDIRARRAARANKKTIKSNEELYASFDDTSFQDEIEYTTGPAVEEVVNDDTLMLKNAMNNAGENIVPYDYVRMANTYSKINVEQQLGSYRNAMEFLAHIQLAENDTIVKRLQDLIYNYPNFDVSSFVNTSEAKLYSWVVSTMRHTLGRKYLGAVYVLGGGIGILPAMLLDAEMNIETIRNFDINGACQFIADEMMQREVLADWKFKSSTQDMYDIDYAKHIFITRLQNGVLSAPFSEIPGTIINTNVSHLHHPMDWYNMLPDMRRVIIVGETDPSLPNPFPNSQTFNKKFPMSFEIYTGVLTVGDKQYYMKIGHK
jgi:hypothetical protein